MESNWAEENLRTIRTLMERSAIYRRALAPVMIYIGVIGVVGGAIGRCQRDNSPATFILIWFVTAAIALVGAFFLVRRQALQDHEPFWSPPIRRVAQAILPPLLAGCLLGLYAVSEKRIEPAGLASAQLTSIGTVNLINILPSIWGILYGCALYSAGFFMPRGVKLFGICIIIISALLFPGGPVFYGDGISIIGMHVIFDKGHLVMGFIFGVCHLIYGAYLYLTEKRKNAA